MKKRPERHKDIVIILCLSLLSLWVVRLAFVPGCKWQSHDLTFNMERYAAAIQCMQDGQPAARWSRDIHFGYGYPLLLFYPPLSVHFVTILVFAGFGVLKATQILAGAATVLAVIFSYILGLHIWRQRLAAAVTAACFVLLPYHLLTLMVRGAMAEYTAQALMPAVLWAYIRLPDAPRYRPILWAGLFTGLLMLTHNATWVLMMPLCLAGLLSTGGRLLKKLRLAAVSLLIGLGISAWYWLPAFYEKSYIAIGNLQTASHLSFRKHYANLDKIFSERWGYDGLGITLSIVWVLASVALLLRRKRSHRILLIVCQAAVPVIIIATTPLAAWMWEAIPIIQYVQFPWRLTAVAGLCAAVTAPAVLDLFQYKLIRFSAAGAIILALTLASSLQTNRPIARFDDRAGLSLRHLRTSGTTTVVGDEYLPLTVHTRPEKLYGYRTRNFIADTPCAVIIDNDDRSAHVGAFVISDQPLTLRMNGLYFPGWIGLLDQKTHPIAADPETGLITMRIPSGDHRVDIVFTNTTVRSAGTAVSLLSASVLMCMVLWCSGLLKRVKSRNGSGKNQEIPV